MKVLAVLFDDAVAAEAGLQAVRGAPVELEDLALVERRDDGRVHVTQTRDVGAPGGGVRGGLVGGVLALAAGVPLAAPAGLALGALIAGAGDRGIDNGLLRAVGRQLEAGGACLVALGDPEAVASVAGLLDAAPTRMFTVPAEAQELLRERARVRRHRQ